MPRKTCLVTGANAGLGKEIALALASSGAKVIMVCRNAEKGRKALEEIKAASGSNDIHLLLADLSSQAEVRQLANTVKESYPSLNVLINNAGLVLTKKTLSSDGIEMTLATNHLAPFLLSQLLLPVLMKNAPSRIINVSSDVHRWAKLDLTDLQYERRSYQFMKAYAQSKLLMNITSFALAKKLEGSKVTLNCVHPGAVKTNLGSDSANSWILKYLDKFIKFFFISPKKAAETPVYLATATELENVNGKYFAKGRSVSASAASYDTDIAKKVWAMSEKLVQLDEENGSWH